MDTTTARMVDFALSLAKQDLQPETLTACKRSLIDSFACMLGAFHMPQAVKAREVARQHRGASPGASVWGCRWSTSLEMAAFANGTMVRLLDLSDTYRTKGGGHPSDTLSAVIAAADAQGASGTALMRGMAMAYEVYCGCADAINLNHIGWDPPTYGAGAAALGAGLVMGLDREQLGHAFGIATASSMALMQTRYGALSEWKNSAGANASRNAVFAASLARAGFSGPDAVLEGKAGLYDVTGKWDWRLPAADGEPLRVQGVYLKNFPSCYHGQASIWAAMQLRKQVDVGAIRKLEIQVYPMAISIMADDPSKWAPKTPETADHSLPYVVASALIDGGVDATTYRHERLEDPEILRLMRLTTVVSAPDLSERFPVSMGSRLVATLADGSTQTAYIHSAMGHADNPMDRPTLDPKFMQLARGVCSESAAHSFLEQMWDLEHVADIRVPLALLASEKER